MKLWKDFGVRALLATIATGAYYGFLFFVASRLGFTAEVAMALIAAGQAPAMLALGFYFGQRTGQQPPGSS